MTHMVEIDHNWEFPNLIMESHEYATKLGGIIRHFVIDGPGGGNPNSIIDFPSYDAALKFMIYYMDGDIDEAMAYLED